MQSDFLSVACFMIAFVYIFFIPYVTISLTQRTTEISAKDVIDKNKMDDLLRPVARTGDISEQREFISNAIIEVFNELNLTI